MPAAAEPNGAEVETMGAGASLAILAGVMALLVSGRVRMDLVGLVALSLVGLLHLVPPGELFSGFSSYAAVILVEMMVIAEGLRRSGAVDAMSRWFERVARGGEARLLTVLMSLPAIPSSFVSDVGLMSVFLPTMVRIRQRLRVSLHRLLMPLAVCIACGGLLSMIGSAGNIIGNSALVAGHYRPIPLFGITPLGVVLVAASFLLMKFWGVRRLPAPEGDSDFLGDYEEVKRYLTEIHIPPTSSLVGRPLRDIAFLRQHHLTVVRIVRQGGTVLSPGARDVLMAGDRLIVQGDVHAIVDLTREHDMEQVASGAPLPLRTEGFRVVEAMIPQQSVLAHQTLREANFRSRFGPTVLAILRQGATLFSELAGMRLHAGDVLMLAGSESEIARLQTGRDILVFTDVEPGAGASVPRSVLAAAVVVVSLALAACGVLPIQVAAAGAVAVLVLSRILTFEQVYRAVDWRIIVLVGGMTPLSLALVHSGVTAEVSRALVGALGGFGPYVLLAAFFWLAALLTQVVSNVAAALVLSPLALSVAASNHWSPDGFIIAMVVALSAAPLTPLANKVFLMTMGPGHYGYRDFIRVGLPLSVLSFALTVALTPVLFPFRR